MGFLLTANPFSCIATVWNSDSNSVDSVLIKRFVVTKILEICTVANVWSHLMFLCIRFVFSYFKEARYIFIYFKCCFAVKLLE